MEQRKALFGLATDLSFALTEIKSLAEIIDSFEIETPEKNDQIHALSKAICRVEKESQEFIEQIIQISFQMKTA